MEQSRVTFQNRWKELCVLLVLIVIAVTILYYPRKGGITEFKKSYNTWRTCEMKRPEAMKTIDNLYKYNGVFSMAKCRQFYNEFNWLQRTFLFPTCEDYDETCRYNIYDPDIFDNMHTFPTKNCFYTCEPTMKAIVILQDLNDRANRKVADLIAINEDRMERIAKQHKEQYSYKQNET